MSDTPCAWQGVFNFFAVSAATYSATPKKLPATLFASGRNTDATLRCDPSPLSNCYENLLALEET